MASDTSLPQDTAGGSTMDKSSRQSLLARITSAPSYLRGCDAGSWLSDGMASDMQKITHANYHSYKGSLLK